MKTMRISIFCFAVLLLTTPMLRAQDFSKYRNFPLGTNLATVLKHTDQKLADVKVAHSRPALIQELTWWPPNLPGTSYQSDSVQQMLFSFYNGELYKISVTYDRSSIEGLSAEDMVQSISAKYGPPVKPVTKINFPTDDQSDLRQKAIASWEDTQFSLRLLRSFYSDGFALVMFSKQLNTQAELAIADAVKREKQEEPQKEAERQRKQTDDLEVARQKNKKSFRP